jgi:hypothetical protein
VRTDFKTVARINNRLCITSGVETDYVTVADIERDAACLTGDPFEVHCIRIQKSRLFDRGILEPTGHRLLT